MAYTRRRVRGVGATYGPTPDQLGIVSYPPVTLTPEDYAGVLAVPTENYAPGFSQAMTNLVAAGSSLATPGQWFSSISNTAVVVIAGLGIVFVLLAFRGRR